MRLIDADTIFNGELLLVSDKAYDAVHAVIDRINNAPTVDPYKHGHWIRTPYTDYDDTYECSVCGESWTFIEGTPKDNEAYYCPKCGARMDEVEDEQ